MNGFTLGFEGFDPADEGLREALTSTGNGYLCTRGSSEWEDSDGVHHLGTYAHGVYNRETTILGGLPVLDEDLVNLPNHRAEYGNVQRLDRILRAEGDDPDGDEYGPHDRRVLRPAYLARIHAALDRPRTRPRRPGPRAGGECIFHIRGEH